MKLFPSQLVLSAVIALLLIHMKPTLAASNVCSTGIYAVLAPLNNYPPAQAFCSAKYPQKRTNGKATTTKITTTKITTTTSRTTTSQDAKASLFSQLVSELGSVASTFCSCILPHKTVRGFRSHTAQAKSNGRQTTTTTTTTAPTTTTTTVSYDDHQAFILENTNNHTFPRRRPAQQQQYQAAQ
jgi:hypothetical protein